MAASPTSSGRFMVRTIYWLMSMACPMAATPIATSSSYMTALVSSTVSLIRAWPAFFDFIEKLRQEEGDFGLAPVLTEADNVVRIMSIHKSKGLEFPVVIVPDLARRFKRKPSYAAPLFSIAPAAARSDSASWIS